VFEDAYTVVPLTLPAHASILTGLPPRDHQVQLNGQRLGPRPPTLATLFKAKGYATAAFVGAAVLDRGFGLARGFDRYDDAPGKEAGAGEMSERSCRETTALALEWLKTAPKPFFLWVHYFDPHAPYRPSEPQRSAFPDPYDGELAAMDACLGDLLAALPSDAFVAVAGDHGEMLGERGEAEHGILLYQGALHIPMVLKGPGVAPGRERRTVSLLDLFPTLLASQDIPLPAGTPGRDLRSPAPPATVLASSLYGREVFGFLPSRAVVDGGFKLLAYGETDMKLFDLGKDPREGADILQREKRVARRLKGSLKDLPLPDRLEVALSAEEQKALASLGYLAPSKQAALVHPEEGLKYEKDVARARERLSMYDLKGAEAALEAVLKNLPRHAEALNLLGKIQLQQGDAAGAVRSFGAVAAQRPTDPVSHLRFGQALAAAGEGAKAETELRAALALNPRQAEAYGDLARLLRARGDGMAIAELKDRAEAEGVENALLFTVLGQWEADQGRLESAFLLFHKAMRLEPANPVPIRGLARTSLQQGKKAQALIYFRQTLRLDPRDGEANFEAGRLVFELEGKSSEALQYLRRALAACGDPARCALVREWIGNLQTQ
jgi:Flp pilus assembly protein TadD